MGFILGGNLISDDLRAVVKDYLPGWELLRYQATALITTTPAQSWDLLNDADLPLVIPGTSGVGVINIFSITSRNETTGLIATTNGELVKVGATVTGTAYAVLPAIASTTLPVGVGFTPALGQAPLSNAIAISSSTTLRLFLTASDNTAPAGTLAAPTAKGVRIPVEVLALRRSLAISLNDVTLSDAALRRDAGL
jgi:hypothetical protein